MRELRAELKGLGADDTWCIEKEEMLGVLRWARGVCGAEGCLSRMREAWYGESPEALNPEQP